MAYAVFVISSVVTGALFALAARAMGLDHGGALFAIAVIGAGLQMLILISWYLHITRPNRPPPEARIDPEGG